MLRWFAAACTLQVIGAQLYSSKGQPWPMPQTWQSSNNRYPINAIDFDFRATGKTCDLLATAFKRFYQRTFYPESSPAVRQRSLDENTFMEVDVGMPCDEYPSLTDDESYTLTTGPAGGEIKAPSVWGALRGLETFSQIVYQESNGTFYVNQTSISDKPRFKHRGVLLDTSRHFLKKSHILNFLDAMEMNKYNVFHWHIVDDQSFPYESAVFPELSKRGAYNKNNHVYTRDDMREIVEYARERGIRVMPEFDTPGHTQSWGPGQPGLLTRCYKAEVPDGTFGPVDPTQDSAYAFLNTFFKEVHTFFPDNYIHLGGDEVNFNCWKTNPNITAFMKEKDFGTDYSKLEQYYIQRLLDMVKEIGARYIIWQEPIDNGVSVAADTVVEVWKTGWEDEMSRVTKLGLKAILSTPWYLNRIAYGQDWIEHYKVEPLDFAGNSTQKDLVIGGEACLWGEWVDGTNLMSRMWPRGSAVAERLWSPAGVNNYEEATPRLQEHRCRMIRRGIAAEPVTGPGFCQEEY